MVQATKINQPVEIVVHFANGKIKPIRIKWKNTVYKVKEIYSLYSINEGQSVHTRIGVKVNTGDHMELAYDSTNYNWKIVTVYLEG